MGRVEWGFKLMGISVKLLRQTPSLFGVILAGLLGSVTVSLGSFYLVLGRWPNEDDFTWPHYLLALPVLWLGTYVSTFTNAVVVATASLRLRGQPATTQDGLRLAVPRLPQLLLWATVSGSVGFVLHVIAERVKLGGFIARWVFGLAWALATALIVPVLVLEDVGVGRGIKRSTALFRQRWGETVTGMAGSGLAVTIVALAVCPFVALLALVSVPLACAAGVGLVVSIIVVSGAFDAVLTAALYQYAVDGTTLGPFQETDLEDVWQRKG
jgi:hypothetical protein